MNALNTPHAIQLLLHYHCIAEEVPNQDAPAVLDATKAMFDAGLIIGRLEPPYYTTTEKGEFHVNALCNLPLPVCRWETPGRE